MVLGKRVAIFDWEIRPQEMGAEKPLDCTGSSESRLVKMPHCWKAHVTAQISSMTR